MKLRTRFAALLVAASLLFGGAALAVDLTDILGAVGGGFLVSAIAGPMNDFINTSCGFPDFFIQLRHVRALLFAQSLWVEREG